MLQKALAAFAAALFALAGVQVASAADIAARGPYKAPPAVAPAPAFSWTGFYIGINGGYGGNELNYPFQAPVVGSSGEASLTSSGFLAGGQLGYNWQTGPWVFGVEADIQWSNIKGELDAVAGTPLGALSLSAGSELEWFGTARGRIGYAWDRLMVYATGGFAYGSVKTDLNANGGTLGSFAFSTDNNKTGWTAGAGFEYAVTPSVSLKTEYLYLDLGEDTVFASAPFTMSENTTVHLVRAGLNWRFTGPAW
jgi:outer membrane immunogenic protein